MRVVLLLLLAGFGCARALPREMNCGTEIGPPPQVFGIAAVKLRVSDLAAARAFYKDFLGFSWRHDSATTAAVQINDRQRIELEVGPVWTDGRLLQVVLAASERTWFEDADKHVIVLESPQPQGTFQPSNTERIATHIAHAGVLVGGLEASLRFYRALGFHETWRGSSDGQHLSWVNLRVPHGDDYLELMLYDQRPAPDQMGGKHHICLSTPNVAYAVAVLQARRGAYARPIEIKVGRNGKRQANLFDPDGTRVELMEPATADGLPVPPSPAPPPRP
jgi:catechol 2,3-dioxygenase-like lactoylglutathione lyase family enzyme